MEGGKARAMAAQARELAAGASAARKQPRRDHGRRDREEAEACREPAPRQHLNEYPRDAQVLSILLGAFGLYAFSGRADHDAAKLAICERHARHYGEDWWFLSYLGWSHTEAGNLSHRPDICPSAPWRCEPKTPTPHMVSRTRCSSKATWQRAADFLRDGCLRMIARASCTGTLAWHVALTALDAGDLDGALAIYEQHIKPAGRPYPPLNIFTDGASLLWRLSLAGKTGLEPHWRDVAAYGENTSRRRVRTLPMSISRWPRRRPAATRWTRDWPNWKRAPPTASWRRAAAAIELCRGIRAFAEGDNDRRGPPPRAC